MESGYTQCITLFLERLDLTLSLIFFIVCVYSGQSGLVLVIPVTVSLIAVAAFFCLLF